MIKEETFLLFCDEYKVPLLPDSPAPSCSIRKPRIRHPL
jgi:hypothetical protein